MLRAALTAVRGKVYTRTETENKIDEKVEAAAYELPVASASQLGGVKGGGTGISIDANGVISATGEAAVNPSALPAATKSSKGAVIVGDGIDVDATGKISAPTASKTVKGSVKIGDGIAVSAGTISVDFAPTLTAANNYTDTKISDLVGGAPATLDTLKEIADYLGQDENMSGTLVAEIGKKADKGTKLSDYDIADAKIANGVITLGANTITPVVAADLEPYAKTAAVTSSISTALEPYAKTTAVTSSINSALTPYAKTTAVTSSINSALTPYAKTADVDSAIANCVKTADLSYMTTAEATAMVTEVFG